MSCCRLTNGFRCKRGAEAAELRQEDLTDRHAALFHAAHNDSPVARDQIARVDFQLRGDDLAEFRFDLCRSHAHGVAHMVRRTASRGDRIVRGNVGIGLNDVDAVRGYAQLFRDDLSHRRLRPLSHLHGAA